MEFCCNIESSDSLLTSSRLAATFRTVALVLKPRRGSTMSFWPNIGLGVTEFFSHCKHLPFPKLTTPRSIDPLSRMGPEWVRECSNLWKAGRFDCAGVEFLSKTMGTSRINSRCSGWDTSSATTSAFLLRLNSQFLKPSGGIRAQGFRASEV